MTALQLRQASQAVLNGQEFFRLFQQLESGGDIYEIDTGTKALCVGPQSDLANYNINFFDFQAPDNIDTISLSIGNPIVGRLDALLATQYPTASGLPAGILISPRDLVDNNWLPRGWVVPPVFPNPPGPGDRIAVRAKPRIDIFSYLGNPPSLAPDRDDRLFQFPFTTTLQSPNRFWYILPYYGRRYGEFSFANFDGQGMTYTINIRGVNLMPGAQDAQGTSPGESTAIETELFGGDIISIPGSTINRLIKSDTTFLQPPESGVGGGMFDLIAISLTNDGGLADTNTVMNFLTSDRIG